MKDNFLDSNIFLYAFSTKDIIKQKIASQIVTENQIISVQVINEVSVNLIKKFHLNEIEIESFIISCYNRYKIIELNKFIFLKASSIRRKYNISYYDSLIISAAIYSNANILYSEDMQHNIKIENLTIINPFK
jgi:predicted nucleic acid-binding protein